MIEYTYDLIGHLLPYNKMVDNMHTVEFIVFFVNPYPANTESE